MYVGQQLWPEHTRLRRLLRSPRRGTRVGARDEAIDDPRILIKGRFFFKDHIILHHIVYIAFLLARGRMEEGRKEGPRLEAARTRVLRDRRLNTRDNFATRVDARGAGRGLVSRFYYRSFF